MLIDNSCVRIWREIAAGRYADGISEDGRWQMAWVPGRGVFALRHGDEVSLGSPRPRSREALYRAWSVDEMELLAELTGWRLDRTTRRRALLVLEPAPRTTGRYRTVRRPRG